MRRVVLRAREPTGRSHKLSLMAKQLEGATAREAAVYRQLLTSRGLSACLPRVFRVDELSHERAIVFLEYVQRVSTWPWRDISASATVMQHLASLHRMHTGTGAVLPAWDYETTLRESAITTLEQLRRMRRDPEFAWLRRSLPSLDRLVNALPARRSELLAFDSFGKTLIHGDLHPGNVIVRKRDARPAPVFIDWARARTGSALEDVSSWLQTLAYWEPEVRRRHDTLLSCYLSAMGHENGLRSHVREAYWIAAGCNALAGALRYHCWKAGTASSSRQRAGAAHAARDWLRIVERASAVSG